eukprot:TRINITY_DN12921_c0_g1_i1.p1 TRINITY_DN12921_c0_g1~~TRINITY_DN12921_c0_g1_i1.p1  ORF type:complete len:173 (+),score=22.83 TRINITY_DN12921_c0_g1_i1:56-574(+)
MERRKTIKFSGNDITLIGNEVKVGEKAAKFQLIDSELKILNSEKYKGKIKVFSVFTSIDTEVCEYQVTWFNNEIAKYDNIVLLNISVDLPFALERFCSANNIKNSLVLSDYRDLDFGMKYGFVIEELRLLSRGIVIVDEEDIIRYVEYVNELTDEPKYELAMDVLKKIGGKQ